MFASLIFLVCHGKVLNAHLAILPPECSGNIGGFCRVFVFGEKGKTQLIKNWAVLGDEQMSNG